MQRTNTHERMFKLNYHFRAQWQWLEQRAYVAQQNNFLDFLWSERAEL